MKRLGISQRVETVPLYGERRDCLDQRWANVAQSLGFVVVPLMNIPASEVSDCLDALSLDSIVLSGGNSLAHLSPNADDAAPERDAFEMALIEQALKRSIPTLGVCRGMQMINVYFGGTLQPIENHAGCQHDIKATEAFSDMISSPVNSYHNWTICEAGLSKDLQPIAFDKTQNVEAFKHNSLSIAGIMWHPEREVPIRSQDLMLMEHLIK